MTDNHANILVVDDIEGNREVLERVVKRLKHNPVLAEDGLKALQILQTQPIDLVLLDVMMPHIDGYEVLSQIKDNPTLNHLPVIMITAVDEIESAINCIKLGAEDYLTKPFNSTLLSARINNALEKKILRDKDREYRQQIEEYNQNLQKIIAEKTHELEEANEKLKKIAQTKNDILKLVFNELQRPVKGVFDTLKTLFDTSKPETTALGQMLKLSNLFTKIDLSNQIFSFELKAIEHILTTAVQQAQEFATARNVNIQPIDTQSQQINDLHSSIYNDSQSNSAIDDTTYTQAVLVRDISDTPDSPQQQQCTEAITELLKTAIKYAEPNSTLQLTCHPENDEITIYIHAKGRLIPQEDLPYFFEIPTREHPFLLGRHPGLEPSAARHTIQFLGGKVSVSNRNQEGISFCIRLKLATITT